MFWLGERNVVSLNTDSPESALLGVDAGGLLALELSTPAPASKLRSRFRPPLLNVSMGFGLDRSRPLKVKVKREVELLEMTEAHRFIARFDLSAPEQSIKEAFRAKYPGKNIQFVDIAEGVTDTKIVKVNGVAQHILKKVSLPDGFFKDHWNAVEARLKPVGGDVREQVSRLFLDDPGQILVQDYSHLNNAQREKLAYVFGADLGVPRTEVLKARNGIFSLHDFVENRGSARKFDLASDENQAFINVQDLQNIGILDILLENQDRNPGNILVVPSFGSTQLNLVPIDHALSFQKKDFHKNLCLAESKPPCWIVYEKSNEPLTDQTKKSIASLDAGVMLQDAVDQGLVVDQKVNEALHRNIIFLQSAIRDKPHITLNELYRAFANSH